MDTIKLIMLGIHNILRWVIMGVGILTLVKMYSGWLKNKNWAASDKNIGLIFTSALDIQLLIGFLLYFVFSDLVRTAFSDFGNAMSNSVLRFFSVEHSAIMLIAVVLGHVAASVAKKNLDSKQKFIRSAIIYTITIALLIIGIPWTLRPLLPAF